MNHSNDWWGGTIASALLIAIGIALLVSAISLIKDEPGDRRIGQSNPELSHRFIRPSSGRTD